MATRPIAGSTFTFEVDLVSQANTKIFQNNPTIASGDFKRSINGGAFSNLDNLPTVAPASSSQVQIVLSASETTSAAAGGRIKIQCLDAAGAEWCTLSILLFVYADDDSAMARASAVVTLQADTDDIQARLPAALVSGRMNSNVAAINDVANAAAQLARSAGTIVNGAAITGTLSTTQMTTDLTEATNDHYVKRIIIWTSGALINQASEITAYNGTTKMLTYLTTTEAPANTDTFVLV